MASANSSLKVASKQDLDQLETNQLIDVCLVSFNMELVLDEVGELKRKGQWYRAIQKLSAPNYSLNTPTSQVELIELLTERAECYERLHEYQTCIKDCDQILKLDPINTRANKRKVICLFGLKRYSDAKRLIQQLTTPTTSSSSSSASIKSTASPTTNSYEALLLLQKRIELELKGVYDIDAIREECFSLLTPTKKLSTFQMASLRSHEIETGPCVRLGPHGEYIHPMIECVTIPEKGVGLRLKSFDPSNSTSSNSSSVIREGTLLMCCTAIFIDQKSDTKLHSRLDKMKRKLHDQPQLLQQIQRLFSGTKFHTSRMRLIQHTNPIRLSQQPITTPSTHHIDLNDEQLELAFDRNSFGDSYDDWYDQCIGGTDLWFIPSLCNHSCIPNCDWRPFGDLMFIYADRNINAGEELTINYGVESTQSWLQRGKVLANWNFRCRCPSCY